MWMRAEKNSLELLLLFWSIADCTEASRPEKRAKPFWELRTPERAVERENITSIKRFRPTRFTYLLLTFFHGATLATL